MDIFKLILIIVVSYLLGSIPSAVIISKKFFKFDIREKGSGNMGSTNAFRILGWKWGLLVQFLDIAKGYIAVVLVANALGHDIAFNSIESFEDITLVRIIAGISAVCGHIWSVFVEFHGGKGINTAAGFLLGIAPLDLGIAVGFFIVALIFSGYVSLGSITAALAFPSSIFFRHNILNDYIPGYDIIFYFSLLLSVLLVFAHKKNIKRLLLGTENRFQKLQFIRLKFKRR
jgi:acyl phosphate:glycerol-3-phosphate acyltransferase